MPNPSMNQNNDDYYISKTVEGINAGYAIDGENGLRSHLTQKMSEERAQRIIGGAEKMITDTRPSEASETDFGLFGGTDYRGFADSLQDTNKKLSEVNARIGSEGDKPSSDENFRLNEYPELVKQKQQLLADKHELEEQQGKVIGEVIARARETGTTYVGDDGPDSSGYAHSDEVQFLTAGVNWIREMNPILDPRLNDNGEITVLGEDGERHVVREDFFTSLKAQRWEVAGATAGGVGALAVTGASAKAGAARGAAIGSRFGPHGRLAGTIIGSLIGGTGGLISSGIGSSILGGAGATLDSVETIGMLEEIHENRSLRLREADGILKKWGLDDYVPYVAQKGADAAVADYAIGKAASTLAKGAVAATGKILGLWHDINGSAVTTDKQLDLLLKQVGLTMEQGRAKKDAWLRIVSDDATIQVGNRPRFRDVGMVPDRFKKANVERVKIRDLSENDQIAAAVIYTGKNLKNTVAQLIKDGKIDNPRALADNMANTARVLTDMTKPGAPYLPSQVAQNLISLRKDVHKSKENFRHSLDSEFNGYDSHSPILMEDIQRALKEAPGAPAKLTGVQDFMDIIRTKMGTTIEAEGGTNYAPNAVSGHRFMGEYLKFSINKFTDANYGKRELGTLEGVVEKLIENKYGIEALKQFKTINKWHKEYSTLSRQAFFKDIESSDLTKETISNIIAGHARNKNASDTPYGYGRSIKALAKGMLDRHKISGKLADDDPIKKLQLAEDENPEDVANLVKAIDTGEDIDILTSLELGAMQAIEDAHSVNIGGLEGLSGAAGTQRITDYSSLKKDLSDIRWKTQAARERVQVVNAIGTVFQNTQEVVETLARAGTSVNVSSGASIANTAIGKAQVELASRIYESAQAAIGDNKFSRAKDLTSVMARFLHGDELIRLKTGEELIRMVNGEK